MVQFADDSAVFTKMYIDWTYYMAPDGKMVGDAFAAMRKGMQGKVGVALKPHDRGVVMYTLHHATDIHSIDVGRREDLDGDVDEAES